ncbi:MAG: hypothetical protein EOP51_33885, partial [Sphingobacteriales bacterium]
MAVGALQKAAAQTLQNNTVLYTQAGATLHVQGDMVNTATVSDFGGLGTLSITGNLTNNKVDIATVRGNVIFAGTTLQTYGGASGIKFNNFQINNPAGLTFGTGVLIIIDGVATFTNGIVNTLLPANTFVFNPTASHTGAKDASHINGYTSVLGGRTGAFSFPVGNGTKLQKLDADITSGASFRVRYIAGDAGTGTFVTTGSKTTPLMAYNTGEHWEVNLSSGSVVSSFTAFWDGTNDANATIVPSVRRIAHKAITGVWQNEGGYGTGTAAAGSVKGNSFTLGNGTHLIAMGWEDITLPLSWLNVNATDTKDQKVQVQWQVSESNVATYIVERNINGAG